MLKNNNKYRSIFAFALLLLYISILGLDSEKRSAILIMIIIIFFLTLFVTGPYTYFFHSTKKFEKFAYTFISKQQTFKIFAYYLRFSSVFAIIFAILSLISYFIDDLNPFPNVVFGALASLLCGSSLGLLYVFRKTNIDKISLSSDD